MSWSPGTLLHHEGNGTSGLNGDGWRLPAWEEMVAGMRRKWGVAWPRLLRSDPDEAWLDDQGSAATAADHVNRSQAVVVVGTPRSGATAVTRVANLVGVPPVSSDEQQRLAELTSSLAHSAGVGGWYAPDEPSLILRAPPVVSSIDVARQSLGSLGRQRPWLWREPYDGLFLPFWVAALDIRPVVLLVLRNPLEVAMSLGAITGRSAAVGLAIWERRLRHALRNLVGLPVLALRYEDLVAEPMRSAVTMERFLQEQGVPLLGSKRLGDVTTYVSGKLRHHHHTDDDLRQRRRLSRAQLELHDLAQSLWVPTARFPKWCCREKLPEPSDASSAPMVRPRGTGAPCRQPLRAPFPMDMPVEGGCTRRSALNGSNGSSTTAERRTAEVDISGVLIERGLSATMARQALAAVPVVSPANRILAGARQQLAAGVLIPWDDVRTVLCLSNGENQHASLLESLGLDVTVVDFSSTASEGGLDISSLARRQFDLVYQSASRCHVSEPALLHAQVAGLLRAGLVPRRTSEPGPNTARGARPRALPDRSPPAIARADQRRIGGLTFPRWRNGPLPRLHSTARRTSRLSVRRRLRDRRLR